MFLLEIFIGNHRSKNFVKSHNKILNPKFSKPI